MQNLAIDVRTMAGDSVSVTLDARSTVADLKLKVEDALLVPPDAQKLCFGDRILGDSAKLANLRLFNEQAIELTLVASQKIAYTSEVGQVRMQVNRLRSSERVVRDEAVKELVRLVGSESLACNQMVEHAMSELKKCLSSTDSMTRRSAVEALAQVAPRDHEDAVANLIHRLADSSEWVRLTAAELLPKAVTPGNEYAMEKLQRILRNRHPDIRAAGLLALSGVALKADEATISLVSEYCDDKNDYIKSVASDALRQLL